MPKFQIKVFANEEGRQCCSCLKYKEWKEFYRDKSGYKGRRSTCKVCETIKYAPKIEEKENFKKPDHIEKPVEPTKAKEYEPRDMKVVEITPNIREIKSTEKKGRFCRLKNEFASYAFTFLVVMLGALLLYAVHLLFGVVSLKHN